MTDLSLYHNTDFRIPISLQPNVVDPGYVKLWIPNLSLKYKRFTPSGCKDIEFSKFEFAANTQLLIPNYFIPRNNWKEMLRYLNKRVKYVSEKIRVITNYTSIVWVRTALNLWKNSGLPRHLFFLNYLIISFNWCGKRECSRKWK